MWLLFLFPNFIWSQNIILDGSREEIYVNEVQYISDPDRNLSIEDFLNGTVDKAFQMANAEFLFDPEICTYWIKFELENSQDFDQKWMVDFKFWSVVDFFKIDEGNTEHSKTGHLVPYKQKDYPFVDHNFIALELESNKRYTCYARLDGLFNGDLKPVDLKFKLYSHDFAISSKRKSLSISFLFIGIYLVMFIYNLFIYISTKDKSYRFYLVSLVILIMTVIVLSGLIFEIFPNYKGTPAFARNFVMSQPFFLTIAVLLFVRDFLRVNERYPLWSKAIKYDIIAVLIMYVVIWFSYDIGLVLIVFNTLPFMFILFGVGIKSYREKFPGALYLIVGHIFWFIGGIGAMFGVIHPWARENDFFANHSVFAGSSIEMVLFSLALANTINYLKRENEEKQEKLIEELRKNAELQTKVNRELEEKVFERTKEIDLQKQHLEVEKDRSDKLLLNILPKEIADELKNTGQATPRYYKEVSILFVDITNFSLMVKTMSTNDLVKDLDFIFSAFDDIALKHRLEKIKTIGDAYMCVGGLPIPNETHACDTVTAGLEMLAFIEEWKKKKHALSGEALNLRIGIHSGPVTAGVVGKSKFQFDIWGDAVNLASRMETSSEPGKINLSAITYEKVKAHFTCEYRGQYQVKNMGKVDMYFVLEPIFVNAEA